MPTKQETQLQAEDVFDDLQAGDIDHAYDTFGSKEWKNKISADAFKEEVLPLDTESIHAFTVESVTEASEDRMLVDALVEYATFSKDVRIIFTKQLEINSFEVHNPVALLDFPETIVEEDITVGEDTNFPLQGKITLPKDADGNVPVVILVHGSGPADYDESAYAYKPFRDIAWGLAEQGIASIRYDKRTFVYGKDAFPNGVDEMTVKEETIDDVSEAIDILLGEKRIDSEHIYLIGHSLGGILGPRIAMENPEIAGFISLAGSPRLLPEISFDQQELFLEEQSLPQSVHEQHQEEIDEMRTETQELLALPEEEIVSEQVLGLPAYYFWEMQQHPVEDMIPLLNIPIYILQGDEDFQVTKKKDYAAWKEVLADKEDVTFSSYPSLNHFFIEHNEDAGTLQETYDYPGTVSAEVIDDIATWLHEQ